MILFINRLVVLFIYGFSICAVNFCPYLLVGLFDLFSFRRLVLLLLFLFTIGIWNYFLRYVWFRHLFIVYFRSWFSLLDSLLIVRNNYLSSFTFFNLRRYSLRWIDFINHILNWKISTCCSGFSSSSPIFGLLRAILLDSLKLDTFLLFILGYSF